MSKNIIFVSDKIFGILIFFGSRKEDLTIMHGGSLLWRLLLVLLVWVGLVGYGLDLVQQGRHVERLRDSRLTMGNTLSQKLVNHLYARKKKEASSAKSMHMIC